MDITERKTANRYFAFDIMRIIAACMVAAIHVYNPNSEIVGFLFNDTIARVAVPFFFACSGFFGASRDRKALIKYLRRISLIYLIWSAAYFPIVLSLDKFRYEESLIQTIVRYSRLLLDYGISGHLWYFPALIFAVLLVYFLQKKLSDGVILIISFVFYFLALFGEPYYSLLPVGGFTQKVYSYYFEIFKSVRNGLFFGFFFLSIGVYLRNKMVMPKKRAVFGLVVSTVLLVAESAILEYAIQPKDRNIMISLLPLTIFLISYLRTFDLKPRDIYLHCGRCGTIIYGVHVMAMYYGTIAIRRMGSDIDAYPILVYLLTVILSIAIYALVYNLSKIRFFKWLEVLY